MTLRSGVRSASVNLTVVTKAEVRRLLIREGRAVVSNIAVADGPTRYLPTAKLL
jgi:hypothetical protein